MREMIGGICAIKNTITGKVLIESSLDISGSRNRYEFCKKTGSAVSLKLQTDWAAFGADAFAFEVLEELKKSENQTTEEFSADIKLLKEICLERFKSDELY
jgi:hypothetical protein